MEWAKIRKQYPDQFTFIGNVLEDKIFDTMFKIISGELIEVSKNPKKILKIYQ